MKRFRFGVLVSNQISREDARRIETLGYASALVPDNLTDDTPLAPLPAATAIAAVTDRLRIGTLVLANDLRHPAQVARDAATLDVLSDGRFELGLGAGRLASDHHAAGLPFDTNETRVARLAESISLLKGLLSGDTVTHHGRFYCVEEMRCRPKCVQQPHPPILIGGGGRAVLELAAREADIVAIAPHQGREHHDLGPVQLALTDDDPTARQIAWIRAAAGDRLEHIEIQSFPVLVHLTSYRDDFAGTLASRFGLDPARVLDSPLVLMGTADEIADDLVARRERFGISYVVVPYGACDAFAPVIARLAGT